MLATLDRAETANAVDVGCGSGILAIAMAKLWQRPVIGGDNDAEAVEVARENAELNGVGDLCRFVHAIGLRNDELQARLPYDLVVANILAGPLMDLSDSFSAAVRPGGRALLSGLLLEQADDILAVYRRWGSPSNATSTSRPAAPWRDRAKATRVARLTVNSPSRRPAAGTDRRDGPGPCCRAGSARDSRAGAGRGAAARAPPARRSRAGCAARPAWRA